VLIGVEELIEIALAISDFQLRQRTPGITRRPIYRA
jgi:hypothetical protein